MINWEEIAKKLSALPPEEWSQLYTGLPADERKELEQAIRIWKAAQGNAKPFPVDKEGDWRAIMQNAHRKTAEDSLTARIVSWPVWLKWAATVLIGVIGLGLVFYNYNVPVSSITQTTGASEIRQVVLPDGTQVTLNQNSHLTYPEIFSEKQRRVSLTGEAWFEVKKNEQSPFTITGQSTSVTVLGTSFNYKDSGKEASLSVVSGKVAFVTATKSDSIVLEKGEEGNFNNKTGMLQTANYENENFLAWKTGVLKFYDKPIDEVIDQLEEYYHIKISMDDTALSHCRFTGKFEQLSRKEVFEILASMYNIQVVESQPDNFYLKGSGCK